MPLAIMADWATMRSNHVLLLIVVVAIGLLFHGYNLVLLILRRSVRIAMLLLFKNVHCQLCCLLSQFESC